MHHGLHLNGVNEMLSWLTKSKLSTFLWDIQFPYIVGLGNNDTNNNDTINNFEQFFC